MTERFPNCSHLKEDLRKGFEFWGQVSSFIEPRSEFELN
jgi:hypothetical protein